MKRALIPICMILFTLAVSSQSTRIEVPFYSQGKDSPWAEEMLGNNSEITIRTHGCALTCISMVVSHFNENPRTPSDMNLWLKRNDGYEADWEGGKYQGDTILNWPALSSYGKGYVYTRFNWHAQPADLILVQYYLSRKIPVIAEVQYKGAPHYIVLTGFDGTDYFMNDPEF
ncbi:MAG: C39 family peptidase, partial [Spirochaetales bacterium]|nr:C39 family peptidase [Spirochaetales bacterium]